MLAEQPTRTVQRELTAAGFAPTRTAGSHTVWAHPTGVKVTVPDGHRTISAGVYRKIRQEIAKAQEAR